jgi:hypothetical protein
MYPAVPTELMQDAVQLVVHFAAIVGAVLGALVSSRA